MLAILGAGSWGSALAIAAARKTKQQVYLWCRDPNQATNIEQRRINLKYLPDIKFPNNLKVSNDLEKIISLVDTVLIATPSIALEDLLLKLKPLYKNNFNIAWATKGLIGNNKLIHQVIANHFPDAKYAVLSGPSFAKEVAKNMTTAVTVATNDQTFGLTLQEYLHQPSFRIYLSEDILGVELGGIVKNVLAVAAGIAVGLKLGANARAALVTRGLAEATKLAKELGAKIETLFGLSGIGDTMLTCNDNQSRNRRFGMLLGQGYSIEQAQNHIKQTIEAKFNAKSLVQLAHTYKISMPIAEQVYAVLEKHITAQEAISNLTNRPPKYEF